ncbi:MAG: DNA polymerase III subunit gamma/tau [Candidatus Fermentibacter sp.]|nr:DNA polymerase III subunit gamma/tau [Candidatus Fermentibacter sp.]
MSYLVFARKWRPQGFEEVLAQDHITVTLRNAIESGRIGHAYLFAGPRGVGKTTTARILAKALNCEKGPTPDPCRVCSSCMRITAGSDLDVLEIDGASNRGIDEIRDLREKARYSSAGGGWKIYIIDEVHMLTREAFNALLKILEEPPPRVLFVFATTEPRKVPATIVSRCQRFDFRRIPAAQMAEYLAREAAGEGIEAEPEALAMVTRASGGSLRDALSIMDQLVSFTGGRITREGAASLLRVVQDGILEGIVGAALAGDPGGALDRVSEAFALGYSVEELNESLVEFLRNLLLAASGGEAGLSDLSEAEAGVFRSLASATCDTAVLDMLRIVTSAAAEARQSSQPRILLESAIVAASRLSWAVSLESLPRVTPAVPAEPRAVRPDAPPPPAAAPARRERVEAAPAPVSPGVESRRSDEIRQSPAGPGYSAGPGDPSAGGDAPGDGPVPAGGGETPGDSEITQSLLDLFDAVSRDRTTDRRSR